LSGDSKNYLHQLTEQVGDTDNIPELPPAPAAWLVREIANRAPGRTTLCCSHGYPLLPLELARAGQSIILLERSPEDAALLMERATELNVLTSFQIYLDTPREMLSRSIDLYHLAVFGPGEAQVIETDVLSLLRSRLLPGGILCLFGIQQKNLASCSDKLTKAGFTIEKQSGIQERGKRWMPEFLRWKVNWLAVIAKSSEMKG
jgi:hypothetical protein